MPFSSLGLSFHLQKALADQNYTLPYPIQKQAIPLIVKGHDILGIAQTGSGKTLSFVLPILQLVQTRPLAKNRHVMALVLVPTRELAVQVAEVFKQFESQLPQEIKTFAVYGGVSINPQMKHLRGVEILVATPGRLLELVASHAIYLHDVEILVLDEADKITAYLLVMSDEVRRDVDNNRELGQLGSLDGKKAQTQPTHTAVHFMAKPRHQYRYQ